MKLSTAWILQREHSLLLQVWAVAITYLILSPPYIVNLYVLSFAIVALVFYVKYLRIPNTYPVWIRSTGYITHPFVSPEVAFQYYKNLYEDKQGKVTLEQTSPYQVTITLESGMTIELIKHYITMKGK